MTAKVTGTTTVLLAAEMVTDPVYVPAASGEMLDVTLIVAGVVPVVGETVSHEPPEATAVKVAVDVAEMLSLCAPGELPPTVAEKDNEVGFTDKETTELTVKVTGTVEEPALLLILMEPR